MKKFLVMYHAPMSASEQMTSASPEQAKAGMDAWMDWAKKAGNAIVDLGLPLGQGEKLTASSASEADATVVGYSILQADSMREVIELLRQHPHLRTPNFRIEVFEALAMPGSTG